MSNLRTVVGTILIITILAIGGYYVYASYLAPVPEASLSTPTPATDREPALISAEGKVLPAHQISLAFVRSGRASEIPVRIGQAVKAGDVLARLDTSVLQASLAQTQATLDTAESNLQLARTQQEQAIDIAHQQEKPSRDVSWETDLPSEIDQPAWYFEKVTQIAAAQKEADNARIALEAEEANLKEVLANASSQDLLATEARLADAQAAFLVANDVLDKARSSQDNDLVDQAQEIYDAAKGELDAAEAAYEQALSSQGAEEVTEARARLAVAQDRYDSALDRLGALKTGQDSLEVRLANEQMALAEAQVAEAQAAVASAQAGLDEATLVAPIDGVIIQMDVEAGEVVTAGMPLIVLADLSEWRVETTDLAESDVTLLSNGLPASISLDAFPGRIFSGVVSEIALVSQEERGSVTYKVTIALEPGNVEVRSGMTAFVDIELP
jgi:HlyD family secretion protein